MPERVLTTLGIVGVPALVFVLAYLLLDRSLTGRISVAVNVETERLKASLAQDVDKARHELALEQAKLGLVYEHQRASFSKIIGALRIVRERLIARYDEDTHRWLPTQGSETRPVTDLMTSECLYLVDDANHALELFIALARDFPLNTEQAFEPIDPDIALQRLAELEYIDNALRAFFRQQIGLREVADPLDGVMLLGAIHKVNSESARSPSLAVPFTSELRIPIGQSPMDTVEQCRRELATLKAMLAVLVAHLDQLTPGRRTLHADLRFSARGYLSRLSRNAP